MAFLVVLFSRSSAIKTLCGVLSTLHGYGTRFSLSHLITLPLSSSINWSLVSSLHPITAPGLYPLIRYITTYLQEETAISLLSTASGIKP